MLCYVERSQTSLLLEIREVRDSSTALGMTKKEIAA